MSARLNDARYGLPVRAALLSLGLVLLAACGGDDNSAEDRSAASAGSDDAQTSDSKDATPTTGAVVVASSEDAAHITGVTYAEWNDAGFNEYTFNLTNQSSERSHYVIEWQAVSADGDQIAAETTYVGFVEPGQSVEHEGVTEPDLAGTTIEVVSVERNETRFDEDAFADSTLVDAVVDGSRLNIDVEITNSSAEDSEYSVSVALLDADGVRYEAPALVVENVGPGETAPGAISLFDLDDHARFDEARIVYVSRRPAS